MNPAYGNREPSALLVRVGRAYADLTPEALWIWLADEYQPTDWDTCLITDPVKVMIEAEYPDALVETGLLEVVFFDPATDTQLRVPVKDWHDIFMAKVVNDWSEDDDMERPVITIAKAIDRLSTVGTLSGALDDFNMRWREFLRSLKGALPWVR